MARPGDELDGGEVKLRFVETTETSRGAMVRVEATYRAGSRPPPRHVHPRQEETFDVLSGRLWFEVDGVAREVGAGSSIVVPAGAAHRARNAADGETKVIWTTRPALQTEAFFETVYGMAQRGQLGKNGRPSLLTVAALARKYDDTWRLASPPRIVQSCVFGLLAPIAAAMGVRV